MEKKLLKLIGITYNQIEAHVFALILQETDGNRRIPIIIGQPEAQAIECKLQEVKTPRPLTHDLIVEIMESFGLRLKEVLLRKLPNGVFAADMKMVSNDGRESIIDARSSDAIGVAVRVNAPIYTTEEVLSEAGFESSEVRKQGGFYRVKTEVKPEERSDDNKGGKLKLSSMSVKELMKAMDDAVAAENYEEAARIKNELDSRKK